MCSSSRQSSNELKALLNISFKLHANNCFLANRFPILFFLLSEFRINIAKGSKPQFNYFHRFRSESNHENFQRATWGPLGFMLLSFGWRDSWCLHLSEISQIPVSSFTSRVTKRCDKAFTYSAKDVETGLWTFCRIGAYSSPNLSRYHKKMSVIQWWLETW